MVPNHVTRVQVPACAPTKMQNQSVVRESSEAGVICVGFFEFDLFNIHLSELQLAREFVVDCVPVGISLDDPDSRLASSVAAAFDTTEW